MLVSLAYCIHGINCLYRVCSDVAIPVVDALVGRLAS